MNFFLEWALAVHRAYWFPLNWALGLERPGIEAPLGIGIALASEKPAGPSVSKARRTRRRPSARRPAKIAA